MYSNNPNLRAEGEIVPMSREQVEEYFRCAEDILYFAENYYYIQTIDDGRIKIPLWDFQKKMLKVFQDPGEGKKHVVVLSARQMSKTTVTALYLLHRALFSKEMNIAILANNERTSREILERIKMAYTNLPLWLQQGISNEGGWNKSTLVLENGVKIIAASTSSNSIRGFTINEMLIDEVSFIADHIWDDFYNSVLPTISSGKSSKIIMVSTPKGMNHFYKIYKDAVDDRNNFRAIKIPWWERPDRDESWKVKTLMEMGSDSIRFQQEYGCKFLGSSNTLIEPDSLERINVQEPVDTKYGGAMAIYEAPIKGEQYIMGVDSAKGNGSDYSTIQVLKIVSSSEIYQVATYRNNMISPDNFSQLAIGISTYYNKAYMMVESNDIGELVVNKIWYDYECDRLINCDSKGLGIRATRKSKLAGNLLLKKYIENGWLDIKDRRTLYELSRYEEISPNVFHAAGQNEHDDCVTSLIWAIYYTTTDFYESGDMNFNKTIDSKYRIDETDMPVFIGDTDNFSNEFQWGTY